MWTFSQHFVGQKFQLFQICCVVFFFFLTIFGEMIVTFHFSLDLFFISVLFSSEKILRYGRVGSTICVLKNNYNFNN